MKKLKLGYAPTRRFVFSAEDAFKYKVLIKEKIESFGIEIDIVDLEGSIRKAFCMTITLTRTSSSIGLNRSRWMRFSSRIVTSGQKIRWLVSARHSVSRFYYGGREMRPRSKTACGCAIPSVDYSQRARCCADLMFLSPM